MKIITLTLCPAFDLHCFTRGFKPFHENSADITAFDAGGKGVNISRALSAGGTDNLAIVAVGADNGAEFLKRLDADGVKYEKIEVPGRIRENITVHTDDAPETRISFKGFSVDGGFTKRVREVVLENAEQGAVVTFTGRLPDGADKKEIIALIRELKDKGIKSVIDSKSFTLADLIEAEPWLIKPNEEEIADYARVEVGGAESVAKIATELYEKGIENVMISLGGKGAVLACRDGAFAAYAPEVRVASTIGAGDSSIAGFIAAFARGESPSESLRNAMIYGTAACMREGTLPPEKSDLAEIAKRAAVRRVE